MSVSVCIHLILMDLTGAQFGCHGAFLEASSIPEVEHTVHPKDQWTYFYHDYDNLVPSTLPVLEHRVTDAVPFDSLSLHSYDLRNPGLSGGVPLAAGEAWAEHSGFQEPILIDWDIYPLLLDLTFTDLDVGNLTRPSAYFAGPSHYLTTPRQELRQSYSAPNPPHYLTTPSQELRQSYSAPDPPFPFSVGCGNLQGVPPVPQDGTNHHSASPTRVGRLKDTVPQEIEYTSPTQISPYMDTRGDNICVCLWMKGSGEICAFESSTDQVKRHIRWVHFRLR